MSSKARRILDGAKTEPFRWTPFDSVDVPSAPAARAEPRHAPAPAPERVVEAAAPESPAEPPSPPPPPAVDPEQIQRRLAELEREAFTKGYASGEQAGLEAGNKRADAMLRRLAETLTELDGLRSQMVAQTERQMVQIALAVARRILRREVSIDQDLVVALARVALDRLGDQVSATVRLNPDDYAGITARRGAEWAGTRVSVVADPAVSRGGCRVESDLGFVDAGIDAQFDEMVHALLGESGAATVAEGDGHLLADPVS
jgi:flagellar assembly protein FliH